MHVVIFAVHFNQFSAGIQADPAHYRLERIDRRIIEHVPAIFCYKDQMRVKIKDAMPTGSNSLTSIHRPSIIIA